MATSPKLFWIPVESPAPQCFIPVQPEPIVLYALWLGNSTYIRVS